MSLMINLLPWRDARRERRARQFYLLLLGMLLVGGALGLGAAHYYQVRLEAQQQRNAHIRQQTQRLEEDISRVHEYRDRVDQLNQQLSLFRSLRDERVQTVRLFNAIAGSVESGVIYRQIAREGNTVRVTARAGTDRQVSAQLRRIGETPALEEPEFSRVESATEDEVSGRRFRFVVEQSQLKSTGDAVSEDSEGDADGDAMEP